MKVNEIFDNPVIAEVDVIRNKCSQFLSEAGGLPLLKQLPETYIDFQKVKVRMRKHSNKFSSTFNGAFTNQINNLRERAIFANNVVLSTSGAQVLESFYIFPINGFKYLFSKEVKNSTKSYNEIFESSEELFTELLKFNYMSENLTAGINAGAEIIIYGIPYYYALRESTVNDYQKLLTKLQ